jgi:hypothetical protein
MSREINMEKTESESMKAVYLEIGHPITERARRLKRLLPLRERDIYAAGVNALEKKYARVLKEQEKLLAGE